MAHPSTLYRFRIDLSDIDRGVYEQLDFRVAMHPSESNLFLLTRVLAFALNKQEGLEFTPKGLGDPDEPCIRSLDDHGAVTLWIEIGSPSVRKLHRAAKAAPLVKVYTYKDPALLIREIAANQVYHAERIEIFSFAPEFLNRLASSLERDNVWGLVHTDGSLMMSLGEKSEQGELKRSHITN